MSEERNDPRKIIHIDMDAFYASVEQRDHPELRGKPIAVGGGERRGVTTTASYEAREYGVRSAMPGWKAKQLCPSLIFVPPRFDVYRSVSREVRDIFYQHTQLVEPLSLDEAFLDVTSHKLGMPYATDIAKMIMQQIREQTQLTCSAGVSYCKFLAKVASGRNKPFGLTIIRPEAAVDFLEKLTIREFFGVGKVTAEKMEQRGIYTGADLKKYSRLELAQIFGKVGSFYYDIVRGVDDRPVKPDRPRKSVGVERTLDQDISTTEEINDLLEKLTEKLTLRLEKAGRYGRTITIKIKTADFKVFNRSQTQDHEVRSGGEILRIATELVQNNWSDHGPVRLVGISVTNLEKEKADGSQLTLDF